MSACGHEQFRWVATTVKGALIAGCALLMFPLPLRAQAVLYWDTTSSTWSTKGKYKNWSQSPGGGSDVAWWSGSDAYFTSSAVSPGAYTVTLDGTQNLGNLSFESGNFTVAGSSLNFVNASPSIDVAPGITATVSSNLTGASSSLSKTGGGTLVISGTNTYTGATNITAGTLRIGAASAVPGATAVTVSGGANFDLNDITTTVGSISGAGAIALGTAALTAGADNTSTTFSGVISGTGGLTKAGSGNLTLAGANTYTGGTTVNAGTLSLGASERIANGAPVSVAAGATLNLNGYTQTVGSLTGAGTLRLASGTLIVGSGNVSSTFSGSFAAGDTGVLEKSGSGTLTFGTGINLASGGLVLNGGTLDLGGFTSSFNSLTVTGNSTLDFSGASILNLNSLTVNSGVTLTVSNWAETVDYFYSLLNPGSTNLGRIVFVGFPAGSANWQAWDREVTPVPEPTAEGVLLMLVGLMTVGPVYLRKRRHRQ